MTMPNRELLSAILTYDEDGYPVLRLTCDCAAVTDASLIIDEAAEFAITCDGCHTVRWFAIMPVVKP